MAVALSLTLALSVDGGWIWVGTSARFVPGGVSESPDSGVLSRIHEERPFQVYGLP
jgi:hypothetical protein